MSGNGKAQRRDSNCINDDTMPTYLGEEIEVRGVEFVSGHPTTLKENCKLCEIYRSSSLISHPYKVNLRSILHRLKINAAELITEELSGFGVGGEHDRTSLQLP
ncbi:hypothetical protein DPMN_101869 [Dreissena polymorpha]|uniref:Uncharacterized protein n=1 Tax=Dreissena polymorpha TaxID=45954 RepID=A0A9D4R9G4_DREPO|nr:hypothetical protein DPMN_101869 [Dreissena polymorpha]